MAPRSRSKAERERPRYTTFITSFSVTIIVGVFFKHCIIDGRPLRAFFYPADYPNPNLTPPALSLRQLPPQQVGDAALGGAALGATPGQSSAVGAAQAGLNQGGGAQVSQVPQVPHDTQVPQVPDDPRVPEGTQNTQVPEVTQVAQTTQQLPQFTQVTQLPQVTQVTQLPQFTQATQLPQVTQLTQVPQVTQLTQVPQVTQVQQVPQVTQEVNQEAQVARAAREDPQPAAEEPRPQEVVPEVVSQKPQASSAPSGAVSETVGGRDVVWELPAGGKVKGVVFIAHSCGSKAVDYWPASPACPNCKGLPEESRLTATLVARGFAAVAVSSKLACWKGDMPASNFEDVTSAAEIFQTWREAHRLADAPAMAFGVSSGGYFISVLAHVVKFESLVLEVSCGVAKAFLEKGEMDGPYPPTLFVYMARDARSTKWIVENMQRLESVGAQTSQLVMKEKALSETFFSDKIAGMSPELSTRIYHALANARCVNATGHLKPTYKKSWEGDLASAGVQLSALMLPKVAAELHCAFGFHAMSAEYAEDMADWFEGVCSKGKPANKRCKYD